MSDEPNTGPADPTALEPNTGPADPTALELDSLNNAGILIRAGAYNVEEACYFLEASHPGSRSAEDWKTLMTRIGACTDCQA